MAWTTRNIPDLTGRTAVVTGANGGLGYETAKALAAAGAHVVLAARDQTKAAHALAELRTGVPDASVEVVELDLGSLDSVRSAADVVLADHPVVDVLVNNAGVMALPERRTGDGFEMQLGVNHLGHFALTAHLLPALLRANAARVVSVSSAAHHFGRAIDGANPNLEGRYGPWKAYGQSKLANFHFAIGLQRRFADAGLAATSLCAHPGLTDSDLQARSVTESDGGTLQRFFRSVTTATGMSPAQGALSQLRAATDPSAGGGDFYGPLLVNAGPPVRKPILRRVGLHRAIATLWEVSERETGTHLNVAAAAADVA
jgi:NAD(P)-dependent dehydrogenase (short-subunit alcohol dehydrogenase family)